MGEGSQKVQISGYKVNTSWRCNVPYVTLVNTTVLRTLKLLRVNLKILQNKRQMHHLHFDLEIPFLYVYPTETSANLKNEVTYLKKNMLLIIILRETPTYYWTFKKKTKGQRYKNNPSQFPL